MAAVYDVLEKDGNHEYGLKYPVDYGTIRTEHFPAFDYEDEVLCVTKVDESHSRWIIKDFEAGHGYFDGTSLMPDKGRFWIFDFDAIFKAACFHDVVYKQAEKISKATGIPVEKILAFADDMWKILAEGYGASKKVTNPIYQCLRFGGSLYHKLRKVLAFLLTVAALSAVPPGTVACYSVKTEMEGPPPDISWVGPFYDFATNAIDRIEDAQNHFLTNSVPQNDKIIIPTNEDASTHVPGDSTTISETITQPTVTETLKIVSFGRPDVSKAVEDPNTQIKDFRWTKDGLSYRWAKGNLRNWGVKDDHDASALAIFGYQDAKGTWRFGKMDWISTDRLTRDMKNVHERYNGIDPNAYFASKHHGFFIMSEDGKRRTNILTD